VAKRSRPIRRSSFFFTGRLEPAELANFNIQNLPLRDRKAILEVLGQGIAVWWPARPQSEFVDLADAARSWFRTIPAAYYIETRIALESSLTGWVEALDVDVREAVIGIAEPRFVKVDVPPEDATVNQQMRTSIRLAQKLRRRGGEIERASLELLGAANDSTAQAFLSAFRALECLRRTYEPQYGRRRQGWVAMAKDLGVDQRSFDLLRDAAEAVRHGDLPARQRARHVVNDARRHRYELIAFTHDLVATTIAKQL
jgi:hypothetical protein